MATWAANEKRLRKREWGKGGREREMGRQTNLDLSLDEKRGNTVLWVSSSVSIIQADLFIPPLSTQLHMVARELMLLRCL